MSGATKTVQPTFRSAVAITVGILLILGLFLGVGFTTWVIFIPGRILLSGQAGSRQSVLPSLAFGRSAALNELGMV
jgi:hypothetical protein